MIPSPARTVVRALSIVLVVGAPVMVPGVASAAPTEEGSMASALFEEARVLMADGRYPEACERLAESHRLEPAGGTLLNLAECRRLQGRTATAYALYVDALALARRDRRDDRIEVCKRALSELTGTLATVRIVVPEASRVDGLLVRMNGVVVPELARGTDLPVDPGSVAIEVEAKGRVSRTLHLDVTKTGRLEVTVEPLDLAAASPSSEGPPDAPSDVPQPARVSDAVAGRPAAMLRLDVDGRGRGAVGYVGVGHGLFSFLEVGAGALLGPSSGFEAGARLMVPLALVRPYANVAMPVFVRDDARLGVRAGGGVEVSVHRHFALLAQASGVYFAEPGAAFESTAFVPAVGVVGRL